MAITPYATPTELAAWLGVAAPANADALLRSATIRVARACNLPIPDAPGDVEHPLRDATCAQSAAWIALGIDPAKSGTDVPAPVKRSKILTGDVELDTTAQTKAATLATAGLCEEATDILFVAGLLWLPGDVEIATGGVCWPEGVEGYSWPGLPEWPFS